MVPDDSLSIASARCRPGRPRGTARTCAISWSRSATTSRRPWRELPKKDRHWILFTDEQPVAPVWAGFSAADVRRARKQKLEPSYNGTFMSARRYLLHTLAHTQSPHLKKHALRRW
jgi:excinuclease ABC subunit A